MKVSQALLALAALALSVPSMAQPANDEAVKQLVKSFRAAEQNYDAATLATLIDSNYIEVSPAGEVDEHDRFLGFYAPDKKVPWPAMTTSDEQVRVIGDTAIDILKFTYTMPGPDGVSHTREIRGSFIAHRSGATWKLLGAQYTGIRPPAGK